ncbi:Hsp20/alpha crystallin family protein [Halosegnis longus]|uniref:Hsp20/alpha crystallin family protein n=1 Tax=Halosegnis longus TaxID=2216012 RepID=A0AAJ4RB01_9EURY|nr:MULTISPECIES: Hsp20/alpha crystallin family protein [Halobacteriales]RNJ27507.1 Hsp20/alpha crystallin family protein [Salella cibi]
MVESMPARWNQGLDLPSRVFGANSPLGLFDGDDYELYEEDGEYVLTVDLPGYDREAIDLTWHDGRLTVAAEHVDEERGRKRTYHRSFRFPKAVDHEQIAAAYTNGVLEVTLPIATEQATGMTIDIEG